MVTTSNAAIAQTTTTVNNGNMLLYNNNNSATAGVSNGGEAAVNNGLTTCSATTTLEQYRLQLYNYALNMERLRGPPYAAAAAMAAAAAYASTTTVSTATVNCPSVHTANYPTTGQVPPPPTSYLCTTTAAGSLIAATTHLGRTSNTLSQCPTNSRLALASMSLFPQRIFQPEEPKPQHSYIGLIAMAILSSAETKLVLSDIYQYILDNYPYFRTRGPGWRNSIRHNLSLNDCFIKSGRSANGKGHYWAIHPANMEDFRKGDFRRRKAQRKVRKHMGLAVDDNGTDSPSPPPAMDLTSPSPPSFQHIVMGSSAITAAQNLAAQSFGWRFNHQHSRQQPPHHAASGSASSYMGQIFSYRPHHYAAAAAAAAALCHNSNTHQHHLQNHQQQLIAPTSVHQHPTNETAVMEPITLLSSQTSTNVQANVINELFSQKRKRQFDVASLLAPDHSNKREPQQHYIRKHTCVNETADVVPTTTSSFHEDILEAHQTANELDIEDIDVVEASEDEDIENDFDEHDDEVDSNSNCHSRNHNNSHSQHEDDEDEAEYIHKFNTEHRLTLKSNHCKMPKDSITAAEEAILRVHDFGPEDDDVEEESNEPDAELEIDNVYEENESELMKAPHNNNSNQDDMSTRSDDKNNSHLLNISNSPLTSHLTRTHTPPPPTASHSLGNNPLHGNEMQHSHSHGHQQMPISTEAHNLFGRYYGTYMAAAAAARINSSLPPVNTVSNNTD